MTNRGTSPDITTWYRSGIRDMLTGIAAAQINVVKLIPSTAATAAYRRGIEDAYTAICQAFGIDPGDVISIQRPHQPSHAAGQYGGF